MNCCNCDCCFYFFFIRVQKKEWNRFVIILTLTEKKMFKLIVGISLILAVIQISGKKFSISLYARYRSDNSLFLSIIEINILFTTRIKNNRNLMTTTPSKEDYCYIIQILTFFFIHKFLYSFNLFHQQQKEWFRLLGFMLNVMMELEIADKNRYNRRHK